MYLVFMVLLGGVGGVSQLTAADLQGTVVVVRRGSFTLSSHLEKVGVLEARGL